MTLKPCLVCGRPSFAGPRCPAHALPDVGKSRAVRAEHDRVRAQVLAEEKTCAICGKAGTKKDPLTFDHIIPRAHGGLTTRANARAAHLSCNSRAGATVRAVHARYADRRKVELAARGIKEPERFVQPVYSGPSSARTSGRAVAPRGVLTFDEFGDW